MDNREVLKTMLQDIINGKDEQAAVSMHDYFVAKTREVAGLAPVMSVEDAADDLPSFEEDAEEVNSEESDE